MKSKKALYISLLITVASILNTFRIAIYANPGLRTKEEALKMPIALILTGLFLLITLIIWLRSGKKTEE